MQRLKTRAQFQAVLAAGTLARTPHFALHLLAQQPARADAGTAVPRNAEAAAMPGAAPSPKHAPKLLFPSAGPWLGAMLPKRWARRAVTRNAIRRQVYAVSREQGVPPLACVVRLRASFDRNEFISATSDHLKAAVRAELTELFRRAAVQVTRRSSAVECQAAP